MIGTHPDRLPANYHELCGVRQFHGCYSMGDDTLWGVVHARKSATNTLAALKTIHAARPDGAPVYIILDNLSAHKGTAIRSWAVRSKVELCFTPTYSSWANPIEAHFGVKDLRGCRIQPPEPRAVALLEDAVEMMPDDLPEKAGFLVNLGRAELTQWALRETGGQPDAARVRLQQASTLTNPDVADLPAWLATTYLAGDNPDITEARRWLEQAGEDTDPGLLGETWYLRFVTAAQSSNHTSAPILDAVVRRWLATHAGLRLNIDEWRPTVYGQYVALLTSWSTKLDLTADTVEELIFRSAISREGSALWGEQWASSNESATPQSPAQMAQATLLELERLFDTADAQAALEARHHLDQLARIIQQGWAN
jgi:hypothetical protein